MTLSSIHKAIALGLCVMAAAHIAPDAWGQQSTKEPVQVSGADLQAWLSKSFVIAGENHANGCVFMILGPASKRIQFYSCPNGNMETVTGSSRVDGDMYCSKWPYATLEQCREWYQIGENKYEQREKGSRTKSVTHYIVK